MSKRPHNICTTGSAAAILGLSTTMVQTLVDRGDLHGWKTEGGHRRIAMQSVLDYQSLRSVPAKPAIGMRRRPKITVLLPHEGERQRWQMRLGGSATTEHPIKIVHELALLPGDLATEPPMCWCSSGPPNRPMRSAV